MVDPPGKTRHCLAMLLSAAVLADLASEEMPARVLARYTFLWGDAMALWASRWRNQLKGDAATRARARECRGPVDELREAVAEFSPIRDFLAAKRQPVERLRADDMEATILLWTAVNAKNVARLGECAIGCFEVLSGGKHPVEASMGLDRRTVKAVSAAMPKREHPDHWALAADSSADLRPYTLGVAQGGAIGRRIAEINDVAVHLEVILPLVVPLHGRLPYDFLVRSALAVELSTLLDLLFGPPPGSVRTRKDASLLELCGAGVEPEAHTELRRLRKSIEPAGRQQLRYVRNVAGAHVDDELTLMRVHEYLLRLDLCGLMDLAEHVLNWLDAAACAQAGLQLLVLGERRIGSWPVVPVEGKPITKTAPDPGALVGALARMFRSIDSPYMVGTASSLGSAVTAGILAGRKPRQRTWPGRPPAPKEEWAFESSRFELAYGVPWAHPALATERRDAEAEQAA